MSAGTIGFGLQKSSLIDYPGRVAAVAFLPGCPFACPYCHNPELVSGVDDDSLYSWAQVRTHLQARFGLLSGLVFSGGEPSMHDELGDYIEDARALGYAIKVDTNGWNPDALQTLKADYIAMDLKTDPARYMELWPNAPADASDRIEQSLAAIRASKTAYEIRITCAPGFVRPHDAQAMAAYLQPQDTVLLQRYRPGRVLNPEWADTVSPYSEELMNTLLSVFTQAGINARIRGA